MPQTTMTAEEFAANRFDLPDGGRWIELIAGDTVRLEPPDDRHGTTVLNLSKAFAEASQQADGPHGYACFDHLIVVQRRPDTVLSPAVSYFRGGTWFSELDESMSETVPVLVVEIASTNDRRVAMGARVRRYLERGVEQIWVIDTEESQVHRYYQNRPSKRLRDHETLFGDSVVPSFQIPVADLFKEPEWWSHRRDRTQPE